MNEQDRQQERPAAEHEQAREELTVEELERRVAPATAPKKAPVPPPYPAGADYGLLRRDNLRW